MFCLLVGCVPGTATVSMSPLSVVRGHQSVLGMDSSNCIILCTARHQAGPIHCPLK